MKNNTSIKNFAHCMSQQITKIADRAVAFLYFYAVRNNCGATLRQIIIDFDNSGLGRPNITKLRSAIVKDKRTAKVAADEWRLKSDKIVEVEKKFQLNHCFKEDLKKPPIIDGGFIDKKRFQALKKKSGKFDFSRLLQMLLELNYAYSLGNCISVILLIRAVLDHVPPIFNRNSFVEVANNYGSKSFKDSMSN